MAGSVVAGCADGPRPSAAFRERGGVCSGAKGLNERPLRAPGPPV